MWKGPSVVASSESFQVLCCPIKFYSATRRRTISTIQVHYALVGDAGVLCHRYDFKMSKWDYSRLAGIFCVLLGIVGNKFVIEKLAAGDGKISELSVNLALLLLQGFFLAAGIFYFIRAYKPLSRLGIAFLLLFAAQFWIRVLLDVPFSEQRMFQALPRVPSFFESGFKYQDQISRYEVRFAELKPLLPSAGRVGYVTSERLSPENQISLWINRLPPLPPYASNAHSLIRFNRKFS